VRTVPRVSATGPVPLRVVSQGDGRGDRRRQLKLHRHSPSPAAVATTKRAATAARCCSRKFWRAATSPLPSSSLMTAGFSPFPALLRWIRGGPARICFLLRWFARICKLLAVARHSSLGLWIWADPAPFPSVGGGRVSSPSPCCCPGGLRAARLSFGGRPAGSRSQLAGSGSSMAAGAAAASGRSACNPGGQRQPARRFGWHAVGSARVVLPGASSSSSSLGPDLPSQRSAPF
jgi:hypothetical protein